MSTRFKIRPRHVSVSSFCRWNLLGLTSWLAVCSACSGEEKPNPPRPARQLTEIERKIGKQPEYTSKPRYVLLALGEKAETLVWLVEDGMSIFIDRNVNGDLTDDGEPLLPQKMNKFNASSGEAWQCEYLAEAIGKSESARLTTFCLHRWNYSDPEDRFGISLNLNGHIPMYAGWFGTLWADSPAKASIIHFGGPLEPKLLREKELIVDAGVRRLSVCLITPGMGDAGPARLSEYAIPISTPIHVRIEWPVAVGSPPLATTHTLREHCCYWEYYDSKFRVPQGQGIVEGTATITIDLPDGKFPLPLRTNKIEARVRMTATKDSSAK